jgi:translation elongation factor EF-Tu-like GTPase
MPKPQMTARVTFLPHDQGGRRTSPRSGVKPHLKLKDGTFTSCFVRGQSDEQMFELGVEYQVSLELPLWEHYRDTLHAGMPLQLNEGSRVVARGTILAIIAER